MTLDLRRTLHDLASEFATAVLHAIRGASLQEILQETGGAAAGARVGGRGRRAAAAASKAEATAPGKGGKLKVKGAGKGKGKGKKGGRLARRSPGDIAGVVDKIVALLEKHQSGLRAEQIRAKLSLEAKELPRPIADALSAKRIIKEGQKRATTYFAREGKRASAK